MDRRKFLSILGLAPLAAKITIGGKLLPNLSSAYDYRFGNSLGRIDKLDLTYWGRTRYYGEEMVALELEKFRQQIPMVYHQRDLALYEYLLNMRPTRPTITGLDIPCEI